MLENSRLEISLPQEGERSGQEETPAKVQIAVKTDHQPQAVVAGAGLAGGEDPSTDTDEDTEKGNVRIIRLGTEEVKKYAIINKKEGVEGTDDDDEDYDREDREELYEDEEEAMENDPEAQVQYRSYQIED